MLIYLAMIEAPEEKLKFEQLYMRYRGLMFHAAMQILNNQSDAEDAVHQAFVSIAENIKKISLVDSPKTRSYIVIITQNKAIDIYRANRRTAGAEFNEELGGIVPQMPGDSGLTEALARLPVRSRSVLLLRYHVGLGTAEIAGLLGMNRDAVRKLIWRAKESLRKLMEEEEL